MTNYVVQQGKNGKFYVIKLTNNKAVKKIGPYDDKGTAISRKNYYTAQDKLAEKNRQARQAQMTAHHNLDDGGGVPSQEEAIRMMDELRRKLKT